MFHEANDLPFGEILKHKSPSRGHHRVLSELSVAASPSGGSVGIAFWIPASTVKTVIAQPKDKGRSMNLTSHFIGPAIASSSTPAHNEARPRTARFGIS